MTKLPPPTPETDKPEPTFPSWEILIEHLRERSERRAWWVAGIATIIALAAVIGLSLLAPYRRIVPYLLAVDQARGNIEYVGTVDARTIKGSQEVLDKHWAQRYVLARESYYYRMLQEDYDTVLELSDEAVGRDYARAYEGPNARDKIYGDITEAKIKIISIQLSENNIGTQATVRFSKSLRRLDNNSSEPSQYFIAALAYRYQPRTFGKEQALIRNPLGYKATAYHVDSELAPTEAAGGRSTTKITGE